MPDFKVFLSYAHEGREYAQELAALLRNHGVTVFDPMSDLAGGENWFLEIGKALSKADSMVVIVSPDALKSSWVRSQWQYAIGSRNYEQRVIPVVLKPTKRIPWILQKLPFMQADKDIAAVAERVLEHLQPAESV